MIGRVGGLLLVVAMVALVAPGAMSDVGTAFDTSAVDGLVDVLDAVMALHADHQAVLARLDSLPGNERSNFLGALRERSTGDPELNRRIDALLETTAYKLYYMQFRNMTPTSIARSSTLFPTKRSPDQPGSPTISGNRTDGITAMLQSGSCG